jgi:hypothetical protein
MKKILVIIIMILSMISCGAPKNQKTKSTYRAPEEVVEEQALEDRSPASVEDTYENISIKDDHGEYIYSESEERYESVEMAEPEPVLSPQPMYKIISPEKLDPVIVNKYEMGRLVYDIPAEMVLQQTYAIEVRIARNTVDLSIYDGMEILVDTIIRTSSLMNVNLIDPTGKFFQIIGPDDGLAEKQFVEMDRPATWMFYVTPLIPGKSLTLALVVMIVKDGNYNQTVYSDTVKVTTTPILSVKIWLSEYWQWFLTVLLIPLIKFGYTKYKKNEKN